MSGLSDHLKGKETKYSNYTYHTLTIASLGDKPLIFGLSVIDSRIKMFHFVSDASSN